MAFQWSCAIKVEVTTIFVTNVNSRFNYLTIWHLPFSLPYVFKDKGLLECSWSFAIPISPESLALL